MIQRRLPSALSVLYIINASLFFVLQMNIAYGKVWELYGLSVDFLLFAAVNFLLLLLFFYGLIEVNKGTKAGIYFSLGLAFAGLMPFFVDYYFLLSSNHIVHSIFYVMVQGLLMGVGFINLPMTILSARKRKATRSRIPIENQKS